MQLIHETSPTTHDAMPDVIDMVPSEWNSATRQLLGTDVPIPGVYCVCDVDGTHITKAQHAVERMSSMQGLAALPFVRMR